MNQDKKKCVKYAIAGIYMLALISGCAYYSNVLKNEAISSIPNKDYETIIRLDTPDGKPIKSDAGFVYVEPRGKVTTDFPREIFVTNLDKLNKYEQYNRNGMGKFVIKDSKGKVRGYYEILPEYRVVIWEREDDILLQVIIPNSANGNNSGPGVGGAGAGAMPGSGGK